MKAKKAKKCFMYLAIALLLVVVSRGVIVSAAEASAAVEEMQNQSIVPYAEETIWIFRIVDGRLQKRLWSQTYGKWLTEWEWT